MMNQRALQTDPTAVIDFHRPDDRFVPIQPGDLVSALTGNEFIPTADAAQLGEFCESLRQVIEQEASALEWFLADNYGPLNPDRDTIAVRAAGGKSASWSAEQLQAQLRYVLCKANFEELSGVQLEAVLRMARAHGLRVRLRPERVQSLTIWIRGRGSIRVNRRRMFSPWRLVSRQADVYRRMVVVAHLKDDPNLHVKVFKEIPLHEIDILLPHAETTMTWFDQITLWGGGSLTIGTTVTKVFGLLSAVAAMTQLAWAVLLGGGLLTYRTVMGYRRARLKRDSARTRHLYFQNLSNNVGAIHYLIGLIAQEEMKEALLAYAGCLHERSPRDELELRYRVESFLRQKFGVAFQFDVGDAMNTLERLGLWEDRAGLRVIRPAEAVARLAEHWRSRQTREFHIRRCTEA